MHTNLKMILENLRNRLESLYGNRLDQMLLYGSQARGDAETDSDIDILVVLKGPVSPCEEIARTEYIVADISLAHNVVIACVFVSKSEYETKRSPLLLNVRREGIAV